jgi:hypothetical protein
MGSGERNADAETSTTSADGEFATRINSFVVDIGAQPEGAGL